jgi:hypothetical protein
MIRALLAGRKTQTRRLIKPQPTYIASSGRWRWPIPEAKQHGCDAVVSASREWHEYLLPHQRPWHASGDRLWVKETAWFDSEVIPALGTRRAFFEGGTVRFETGATGQAPSHPDVHTAEMFDMTSGIKKRSSLLMPRWASRLTLIVEDVKIELLQDISEADAIAEGCTPTEDGMFLIPGQYLADGSGRPRTAVSAVSAYDSLWQMINGAEGPKSWDANPWVSATTFSVITQNIDQIARAA